VSISDEELALLGAPWAKEGMLCRKQYWESSGKRAKSRTWQDVFVVIQKGELDMFIFGERGAGGAKNVGGGNWLVCFPLLWHTFNTNESIIVQANAQLVGNVVLAHSLAHALPPPGYNRQRPHCFVLTLASGGVFFFQTGTEDLLNEWVTTCNYWAARQSKEPLSGGVSNMEYGWNRVLDPVSQITTTHDDTGSIADVTDTFSMRSGKSNRKRNWPDPSSIGRSHDRIFVNEWKAPLPSTVSSTHDEETQLEALQKQVVSLKQDLQTHNELRKPMSALVRLSPRVIGFLNSCILKYGPRSSNYTKSQTNWEKKSQYLLTEIVKYETYVESLKNGMSLRLKKRGEKALEKALVTASPHPADFTTGATGRIYSGNNAITEGAEPSTPGPTSEFRHRRESAQGDDDDPATP
jgi:PH and SEC7 domain-containing protein